MESKTFPILLYSITKEVLPIPLWLLVILGNFQQFSTRPLSGAGREHIINFSLKHLTRVDNAYLKNHYF